MFVRVVVVLLLFVCLCNVFSVLLLFVHCFGCALVSFCCVLMSCFVCRACFVFVPCLLCLFCLLGLCLCCLRVVVFCF